ncbi:MAG: transposase family protein [Desulfobacterales bacterium]
MQSQEIGSSEYSAYNIAHNLCFRLRDDQPKVRAFWEDVAPTYYDKQFRRIFRVPRNVFGYIFDNIEHDLTAKYVAGRSAVEPDKKLAIFLKYVGGRQTIYDIGQTFGVTDFSVIKSRREVSQAILDNLLERTIKWPGAAEKRQIADNFNDMGGEHFPGIIGCLDGCHIPVSTPLEFPDSYFNRKKFHSVVLQGTVKDDCSFIDVSIGCPGRFHDAKVLRNSDLWFTGYEKCSMGRYHLVGDAAYPITRWLITPYRRVGQLRPEQAAFNGALSSRRQVVERGYGIMKQRFRRVKLGIEMRNMEEICRLILATCVLHNLCIWGDQHQEFDDEDDDEDFDANDVRLQPVPNVIRPRNILAEGQAKRHTLTYNL